MKHKMDYTNEPHDDILCVDVKSFYASVECVERGLNPLTAMLVVMSNAENARGLVLAASPAAKKRLGLPIYIENRFIFIFCLGLVSAIFYFAKRIKYNEIKIKRSKKI